MKLLYYTLDVMNDTNELVSLRLFLAISYDNADSAIDIVDLLSDPTKLDKLRYDGYDLSYIKVSSYPNPLVVVGEEIPEGLAGLLKINSVYDQVLKQLNGSTKLSPDIEAKFISLLTQKGLTESESKLLIMQCYALRGLLLADVHIPPVFDISKVAHGFTRQTQSWLNDMLRENTMASIPDNETKFQPTCTSELFIKLPTYEAMISYSDDSEAEDGESSTQVVQDMYTFMPARAEVSNPYGVNTGRYEDPDNVLKMTRDSGPVYENVLKEITGNPDNNTDEIFDNEKRYYDALNTWLGIIQTAVEGKDDGEMCYLSLDYLKTLAETLYIWYWQHNPRVPCSIEVKSRSDEESKYIFRSTNTHGIATVELDSFLESASAELLKNSDAKSAREVYVKAIIQLARWGSRKPTAIVIDGYSKTFDLNVGCPTKQSSFAAFEKVKTNGCDYEFTGFITDASEVRDPRIGFKHWPMPVGAVVSHTFENKSTGETITLPYYFSMIDIVKEIVTGNISVSGITYENEAWTVRESSENIDIIEAINASKQPGILQFPIFRGAGLVRIYSSLHIVSPANTENQLSLMHTKQQSGRFLSYIDANTFDSYAGLDTVSRNGNYDRKQVTDYMITRDLLKVYHEAATNFSADFSNSETFNCWHQAILNSGYVDEAYFYKQITGQSEPLPGCHTEAFKKCFWHNDTPTDQNDNQTERPQRMNLNDGNSGPNTAPQSTSGAKLPSADFVSAIIMQPTPDCAYCKFVDNNNNLVCVGALNNRVKRNAKGMEKVSAVITVLDQKTCQSLDLTQIRTSYPISKLLLNMVKAFYSMSKNAPNNSDLRFISSDAIRELHAYFKDVYA